MNLGKNIKNNRPILNLQGCKQLPLLVLLFEIQETVQGFFMGKNQRAQN